MEQAIQVLSFLIGYGGLGVVSGVLMYRTLVTRGNAPGSENLGPAALMAGVFWPVGLWIALSLYLLSPRLARSDQKDIRRRQNSVLKQIELLEIEKMEHKVEKERRILEISREQFYDNQLRTLKGKKPT